MNVSGQVYSAGYIQTDPLTLKDACQVLYLPYLHKVKVACRRRRTLQFKIGEVQHDLHIDLHNDIEDAISIVGIVVRVIW